ncbi:unnamed protein product [Angiostrongylus costaricensis]|uniref:Uncharacterized protein n=1 Tax=Angiostrongylus costaricensis TaxID=334426 RepID=A0A0R3PMA0_ANGCS|nr:unnamed protein product [Angiostrongylus costaricensis]
MTDTNESDVPVFDQPPPKFQSHHAHHAASNPPEINSPPPSDSSRSSRRSSKSAKARDTTTTAAESPRSTTSSMKSAHRSNLSRNSSSHIPSHAHRSDSLPAIKKTANKKSLSLPVKQDQSATEPTFTSPRCSISTTGTSVSDLPRGMRYTSIDLENELPEIFSSSLNPAIQDPDMSEFYSRGPPFYKTKSPPPLYISRKASMASSVPSIPSRKYTPSVYMERRARLKIWLTLFIAVFFIFPILIIVIFRLLPSLIDYLDQSSSKA